MVRTVTQVLSTSFTCAAVVTACADKVHITSSLIRVVSRNIAVGALVVLAAGSTSMFLTIVGADIMTASHCRMICCSVAAGTDIVVTAGSLLMR